MADIKFSQFTSQTNYTSVQEVVGYNGASNVRISPSNLISSWNSRQSTIDFQDNIVGTTSTFNVGSASHTQTDLDLITSASASYKVNGLDAVSFDGSIWTIGSPTGGAFQGNLQMGNIGGIPRNQFTNGKLWVGDGTNISSELKLNNNAAFGVSRINFSGSDFLLFNPNPSVNRFDIGVNQDIQLNYNTNTISTFMDVVHEESVSFQNDVKDKTSSTGNNGDILVSNGGSNASVTWVPGYSAFQTFVWTNGTPVAYTNWGSGVASYLPFDATPLINVNNLPGGFIPNYTWTCVNAGGGTAGQVATFTLGTSGGGTWKIRTCQHWFDQTNQVEMRASLIGTATGSTKIDIIDQKSTELTGDKIFYGELVQTCGGGDTIQIEVEFTAGGVNPFPSATGNRPIEITFERVV